MIELQHVRTSHDGGVEFVLKDTESDMFGIFSISGQMMATADNRSVAYALGRELKNTLLQLQDPQAREEARRRFDAVKAAAGGG